MTDSEYIDIKHKLLRRKTYPFFFKNDEDLALEFFNRFKEEFPTARYYEYWDASTDNIDYIITHDRRAEMKLCEHFEILIDIHKKCMVDLGELIINVEESIRSKETALLKQVS